MLRRFFKRVFPVPIPPTPTQLDARQLAWCVQADGRACRPLLITADTLEACEAILTSTLRELGGCVLHLKGTSDTLKGFEHAPLMGTLTDKAGRADDECLDTVLEYRLEGHFQLDMPAQYLARLDIEDLLNQTLLASALHFRARLSHSVLPPLTIVLDNWRTWLPEHLLKRLMAQAQAFQYQVVLTDEANRTANYLDKVAHVVSLPTLAWAICNRLEGATEVFGRLPEGVALYVRRSDYGTPPTLWRVAPPVPG